MAELFLRLLIKSLGALPLPVRAVIGGWGGALFSLLPLKERHIAELQMTLFLKPKGVKFKVSKVYASLGRTLLEALDVKPMLAKGTQLFECDHPEVLDHARHFQGPIVALTGHCGNWDLLAAYIISRGLPITTAGRVARNPIFQRILADLRATYGIKTLWRSESLTTRGILKELRPGQVVATLVDQDTDVHSLFVPFFGRPAKTPSALLSLAKRVKALIITAFLFRTNKGYKVYLQELDPNLTEEELLVQYHQRLESLICQYPEQWVWIHKRWRTLPTGKTLSSREYLHLLEEELREHGL